MAMEISLMFMIRDFAGERDGVSEGQRREERGIE
jgi:hypothetical protein